MTSTSPTHVDVEAPARLHLGFLDLQGGLGRRFGSLGLAIEGFATRLRAEPADDFSAEGPGAERAVRCARKLAARRGLERGARLQLREVIPEHAGLGSGTQLALAVGTALERLNAGQDDTRAIAHALGRGMRSGIGIGAFDEGGFIIDCGRGERDEAPPIAIRLPFPEHWRVLLLFDQRASGLHGATEKDAFRDLPEFPEAAAGHLCRLTLMKLVPALTDADFRRFAEAVGEIQRTVGDHFAPAQGGRFASPLVAEALAWLEGQGIAGIGQSSWGPTGFVLADTEDRARALELDLKRRFGELSPLRYRTVAARNRGAIIDVYRPPAELTGRRVRRER